MRCSQPLKAARIVADSMPIFFVSIHRNIAILICGSREDILQQTREVRDEIERQIKIFVQEAREVAYWIPVTETNLKR